MVTAARAACAGRGERMAKVCTFPERLRRLRERNRLKQCVLAELCGLDYNAIKRYETGKTKPTMDALVAIADYFEVSIDYLIGRSDYPKSL